MKEQKRLAVILIGPQGSGKGTQSALLQQKGHFHYIASGDIVRKLAKEHSSLGEEVRKMMNEGVLLPDSILNHGIEQAIAHAHSPHILFDGYPRTLSQAKFLLENLEKYHFTPVTIHLTLDDITSIERIRQRRICSQCGSIIYPQTPKRKLLHKLRAFRNACPHCGGKLIQRTDDTEEAVKKRLKLYHKETEPVINYYSDQKIVHTVDAKPAILDVYKEIGEILDKAA